MSWYWSASAWGRSRCSPAAESAAPTIRAYFCKSLDFVVLGDGAERVAPDQSTEDALLTPRALCRDDRLRASWLQPVLVGGMAGVENNGDVLLMALGVVVKSNEVASGSANGSGRLTKAGPQKASYRGA